MRCMCYSADQLLYTIQRVTLWHSILRSCKSFHSISVHRWLSEQSSKWLNASQSDRLHRICNEARKGKRYVGRGSIFWIISSIFYCVALSLSLSIVSGVIWISVSLFSSTLELGIQWNYWEFKTSSKSGFSFLSVFVSGIKFWTSNKLDSLSQELLCILGFE